MSDGFDELVAGVPDERPGDNYGGWLKELEHVDDEDSLFASLASQRPPRSPLARQQIRGRLLLVLGPKLKELKSGATPAKVADAWLQEGDDDAELLQGKEFVADEVEPWDEPVAGREVLDEVHELFGSYLYAPEESLVAITLWTAYSHAYGCFGVSPLLELTSPTKRCGKSTVVVLLRHLCRVPLLASNITPAALFRAVEQWEPTLLIDEADTFATMHDELRGILNAGHTRDTAFVLRADGESHQPRVFSTWGPKVIAAIGRFPDTIEDRAIRVPLSRKPTSIVKRDAFDPDQVRRVSVGPRRRLARLVLDSMDKISSVEVERPAGLNDRAWNNWRPLLAVATAGGDEWQARGLDAARVLAVEGDPVADLGTLALQHVWEAVQPVGRMRTADVLAALVARDDRDAPWASWWESSLTRRELKGPAARLARMLRPFGVRPKPLWIDDRKERGYSADDFHTSTVAPYLNEVGRTAQDGRTDAVSREASTVPTEITVGPIEDMPATRSLPIPGDSGYLEWLETRRHWLTDAEWRRRRLHHFHLFRLLAATDRRGQDGFVEDAIRLFDAYFVDDSGPPEKPVCRYPSHRQAGDWQGKGGRLVCRVCHPPAAGGHKEGEL